MMVQAFPSTNPVIKPVIKTADSTLRQLVIKHLRNTWNLNGKADFWDFSFYNYYAVVRYPPDMSNDLRLSEYPVASATVFIPTDTVAGVKGRVIAPPSSKMPFENVQAAKDWASGVVLDEIVRRHLWSDECRSVIPPLTDSLQSELDKIAGMKPTTFDIECNPAAGDDAYYISVYDVIGASRVGVVGGFDKLTTRTLPRVEKTATGEHLVVDALDYDDTNAFVIDDFEVECLNIAARIVPAIYRAARSMNYQMINGGYYVIDHDFVLLFKLLPPLEGKVE